MVNSAWAWQDLLKRAPPHPHLQPLGMGCVGVRMLHIMLCIMLHVLDHFATFPRPTRPTLIMNYGVQVQNIKNKIKNILSILRNQKRSFQKQATRHDNR